MTNRPAGCRELAFLSFFLLASCLACGAAPLTEQPPCTECSVPPMTLPQGDDEGGRAWATQVALATSVVLLDMGDGGIPVLFPICSGNWIAPQLFLTAHHCAVAASMTPDEFEEHKDDAMAGTFDLTGRRIHFASVTEIDPNGLPGANIVGYWNGTVAATDAVNDVAIMRADVYRSSAWATIAFRELERGERLHAIGHHAALTYSYIEGYVAHPRRFYVLGDHDAPATIIQAHTGGWFGSSGAGWFVGSGELVGVMSALARGQSELSLIIHWSAARSLLARLQK